VVISYRAESFSRLKPANFKKIEEAQKRNQVNVIYESNLIEIGEDEVKIQLKNGSIIHLKNDLVYIFAGGEMPNKFLEKIGIKISKKFGEAVLKH
jgi:thioredoxin reductase